MDSQSEDSQSIASAPVHNLTAGNSIDFSKLLRFKTASTRALVLRLHLGKLTESSLQEFLLQSRNLPSEQLQQEVQSIVIEELALIDPERALDSTDGFSSETQKLLVQVVFQVWSIANLDQATQFASDLTGLNRLAAVEGILISRDDLANIARQELAKEILGEDYSNFRVDELFLDEAISDPEAAWNEFISQYKDSLSQLPTLHVVQLANIAGALEEVIGTDVFDRIQQDIPSSIQQGVIASVFDRIASKDPSRALDVVLELKPNGFQYLAARIVSAWAQSDPQSAMAAIGLIQATGIRSSLQAAALFTWVDIDPFEVVDEIERVPDSLRALIHRRAMTTIAFHSPEKASKLLDTIENYGDRLSVAEAIVSNWAKTNFQAVLNWVRTSQQISNDTMRHSLLGSALDVLAESDPETAFRYALDEDVNTANVGPESSVIASVVQKNLDKAMELLSRVRNGSTKEHTIGLMGVYLVRDGESLQAIELSNQLPLESRSKYMESLTPSLLTYDPGVLADNLDNLSSYETRSRTASLVLSRYEGKKHALTPEQITKLKQYHPD